MRQRHPCRGRKSWTKNGLRPSDVLRLRDTYRANRQLFRGPGALRIRLQEGAWPVAGVREPEDIAAERKRREQSRAAQAQEESASLAAAEAFRETYRRLDAAHGRTLDEMPFDARRALEARVVPAGLSPRAFRFELLEELSRGCVTVS